MKKFLVTLLVAMLALSTVALADAYYPAEDWLTHLVKYHTPEGSNTDWENTTTEKDYYAYKAAFSNHKDWPDLIVDPDCDTAGRCYHDDEIYYIKALGHKWDDGKMTAGDCTEQVTITYSCKRVYNGVKCDGTKTETTTGTHINGIVWVQEANCYDHATYYYGCPTCGAFQGEKVVYTWWKNGVEGHATKGVKVEGDVTYVYEDKNAPIENPTDKQHKLLSPWMETEKQDCVNPKVEYRACPYCGYEQTKVTAPLGHSFEATDTCKKADDHKHTVTRLAVNASNCKTVALYINVEYCVHEGCDKYITREIPSNVGALAANYYTGSDKNNPYYYAGVAFNAINDRYSPADQAKIYCLLDANRVPMMGHHIVDESKTVYEVTKASTCVEQGTFSQATYCSVCKKAIPELSTSDYEGTLDNKLPLAKHTWGEWEHLFDASEDSDFVSYWRRQCSVCLIHETSVEGPCGKYNHTAAAPVKENVVKATFTAAGSYEDVVYCSICKTELSREEKVEAMLEGLNPADGKIWEDGKAIEGTGMVEFNGGKFYVVDGVLQNAMGVTNVGGEFLFLAHGQLQEVTQLAEYDGEWFYVVDGEVQVGFNGLVEYDGAKFLVGAGRVQFEQTTLFNDGTQWVLISAGQVATSYTGAFTYDGVVFQVVNGIVK